jgi:hypothetical protein
MTLAYKYIKINKMDSIKLQIGDSSKTIYEVSSEMAKESGVLADILEDGMDSNVIPLLTITSKYTMDLVIEFMKMQEARGKDKLLNYVMGPENTVVSKGSIEKPIVSDNIADSIPKSHEEFATFINKVANDGDYYVRLSELAHVSNYLDMKSLLDLCAAKIGSLVRGREKKDICKMFNIPFSDEKISENDHEMVTTTS